MKLKNCNRGRIIVSGDGRIGMIIGITNNCPTADIAIRSERERAIPLVQWAAGGECGINPYNIEPLN